MEEDDIGTQAGYLDHAVIASDGTASLRIDNQSGGKIIGTRWIDVNKGDEKNPVYRSRLVGKEFHILNRPFPRKTYFKLVAELEAVFGLKAAK